MAKDNPWYGYKRIAAMCRRQDKLLKLSDRPAFRVMRRHDLLQPKRTPRKAGLYQSSKLYELLPNGANELWQMDVTRFLPGSSFNTCAMSMCMCGSSIEHRRNSACWNGFTRP